MNPSKQSQLEFMRNQFILAKTYAEYWTSVSNIGTWAEKKHAHRNALNHIRRMSELADDIYEIQNK